MLSDGFNYSDAKEKSVGVIRTKMVDRMKSQSSFSPSQKIVWEPSQISNGFMDLRNFYLKFDIISTGVAKFDQNAYCLFKSIKVETKSGVLIDYLDNANVWYGLSSQLDDYGSLNGYDRVIGGGGDDIVPYLGMNLQAKKTFCVPFNHGIFSCKKYIPLFGQGLRFTFQLGNADETLLGENTAGNAFTMSNVQMVYPLLTLDNETFSRLNSSTSEYRMDFNSLSNHQTTVLDGSLRETIVVPSRFSSVNSMTLIVRQERDAGSADRMKYSHRIAARLESIQLKHKGSSYPQQALTRTSGSDAVADTLLKVSSEMFLETMSTYKTINSGHYKQAGNSFIVRLLSRGNDDGGLTKISAAYEIDSTRSQQQTGSNTVISSDTANEVGSFFVSIPLAQYKSPEEVSETIYSGVNSLGDDFFCEMEFGGAGVPEDCRFDFFSHYSAVLVFDKSSGEFQIVN